MTFFLLLWSSDETGPHPIYKKKHVNILCGMCMRSNVVYNVYHIELLAIHNNFILLLFSSSVLFGNPTHSC